MERERGWSGRMSEKMLNKQECLQPPVGDYTSTTAVSSYKTVREPERWKRVGVGVWDRPKERESALERYERIPKLYKQLLQV